MKQERSNTSIELFICNYKRDDDECCFDKGAKELTDQLKKWTKEEQLKEIKVYRSGCLSRCSEGIAALCYPSKDLLLDVKLEDGEEIKKGLREALQKIKD
jgi:predicted metal-binding protein